MKEIHIGANEQDKRLDRFLNSYLKEASMGFIYKMLRKKNITLNGKKSDGTDKLKEGDVIRIFFADDTLDKFKGGAATEKAAESSFSKATKALGELPVVYEDDNIVLVNKPAGVLSQKSEKNDVSLNEWLIEYLLDKAEVTRESLETYRPSICNRLDRNTSGLVICAKSLVGARKMNELIKDRSVGKYYRTIVRGKLDEDIYLKGYLHKDECSNKVTILEKNPHKPDFSYIETKIKVLEYKPQGNVTLLEVELITGKPHQIRAHLSSINHPIIGDIKYGGKPYKGIKYQLLHSYRLEFPNELEPPFEIIAGKSFIAELPEAFNLFV
jgi:23S rRNA pseudouridine955/2504/2580 synthase